MPVMAICYDFDRTLSPENMQAQGYIQALGYDVEDFWREADALARENEMDGNLAYMYVMAKNAAEKHLSREALMEYGGKVKLYAGADEWFGRIKSYGLTRGVAVEHYIVSSGLKEMIEGTLPARRGDFKKIYAGSFCYDKSGVAVWPAQAVNYTNKTQFLFRIEKGVLDVNDGRVNDYFPPEKLRVPFENMVYIGDSDTDVPCMKLVSSRGGHAIGVYDPHTGNRKKVDKLLEENRIDCAAAADYTENSPLDGLVKRIIDGIAARYAFEKQKSACLKS